MANFPTKGNGLSQGESPSLYDNQIEDNVSHKADTDGGYEFRRRKFTRAPRRIIKTGFISLVHADFQVLEEFYEAHLQDVAFVWHDYIRDRSYQVRFDKFTSSYSGVGTNRRWDVKIEMSEI